MDWRSKESGPNKYPSLHLQKHLGTEHPFSTAPGDDKHIMHIYTVYGDMYNMYYYGVTYTLCTL